jgi:glycosyltransferase involved in cell wall biosynthesis
MAAPLLGARKIPIVLWYTHKSVTWVLRLATLLVKRVVTASTGSFRIKSPKVRVIGHGIDVEKFTPGERRPFPADTFTILTVSRLSQSKRIDLLIEAVALLRRKKPGFSACLKIVGKPLTHQDQRYVAQLQQQVEQNGLQGMVVFEGGIPFQEILPCYQQADCFVSMSETGSIDKAVLEAMSCEVAVIANPAFADILGAELAEKWVVNRDTEQLCERVIALASMPEKERDELAMQLRDIVKKDHDLVQLSHKIIYELKAVRNG